MNAVPWGGWGSAAHTRARARTHARTQLGRKEGVDSLAPNNDADDDDCESDSTGCVTRNESTERTRVSCYHDFLAHRVGFSAQLLSTAQGLQGEYFLHVLLQQRNGERGREK